MGVRQILKNPAYVEIDKKKQNESANSVDPDEMAHEPSHLDLHSLSIHVFRSIVLNGLKYFKNSAM